MVSDFGGAAVRNMLAAFIGGYTAISLISCDGTHREFRWIERDSNDGGADLSDGDGETNLSNGGGIGSPKQTTSSDRCPDASVEASMLGQCRPILTALSAVAVTPDDSSLIGNLVPPFAGQHANYELDVSFWTTQIRLIGTFPAGSTMLVNGTLAAGEGPIIPLNLGENTIQLVLRRDSIQSEYFVLVRRRQPVRIAAPDSLASGFGHSLAAAPGLLIVGAPGLVAGAGGTSGSAIHMFRRSAPGNWQHVPAAVIRSTQAGAGLGAALAYDGTTLAAGAPGESVNDVMRSGSLHLYTFGDSSWIESAGSGIGGSGFAHQIGGRLAVSGAAAATTSVNVDVTRTLSRNSAGVWVEDPGSPLADGGAGVVAIDGNLMAISQNGSTVGVNVYQRSTIGSAWTLDSTPMLTAPGMRADHIALSGRTLVVNGRPVSVFEQSIDRTWDRTALPLSSFGSVSVTDTTLVVGADQGDDSSVDITVGGSVSVFRRPNMSAAWQADAVTPLPTDVGPDANFGVSVASAGRTVFVGASREYPGGAVYIYE